MKHKYLRLLLGAAATMLTLTACSRGGGNGSGEPTPEPTVVDAANLPGLGDGDNGATEATPTETAEQTEEPTPAAEEIPAGMYRSELTNEIISEDLKNQRPIAVMVDNETTALPHYGTSKADIVYELGTDHPVRQYP